MAFNDTYLPTNVKQTRSIRLSARGGIVRAIAICFLSWSAIQLVSGRVIGLNLAQ